MYLYCTLNILPSGCVRPQTTESSSYSLCPTHILLSELFAKPGAEFEDDLLAVLLDALEGRHVLVLVQYLARLHVVPTHMCMQAMAEHHYAPFYLTTHACIRIGVKTYELSNDTWHTHIGIGAIPCIEHSIHSIHWCNTMPPYSSTHTALKLSLMRFRRFRWYLQSHTHIPVCWYLCKMRDVTYTITSHALTHASH